SEWARFLLRRRSAHSRVAAVPEPRCTGELRARWSRWAIGENRRIGFAGFLDHADCAAIASWPPWRIGWPSSCDLPREEDACRSILLPGMRPGWPHTTSLPAISRNGPRCGAMLALESCNSPRIGENG